MDTSAQQGTSRSTHARKVRRTLATVAAATCLVVSGAASAQAATPASGVGPVNGPCDSYSVSAPLEVDAVHDGGSVFVDFTPSPCQEVQNVIWYYAVDSATGQRAHCYENPGTNVEAAKSDCAMGFTIPVTTCQKGAQDTVTVYGYNANGPGASTQSMPFPLLPATSCVVPNP